MKTIKTIISDNFKMDFYKIKKDYVVHLVRKSYPSIKSVGTTLPKVGMKFAKSIGNNQVEFWERINKTKTGESFKLIGTYTYTEVEVCGSRVVVKKQAYLHKDILMNKEVCELFYDNGNTQTVSGSELVAHLFEGQELSVIGLTVHVRREAPKVKNLLNIPDEKLTGIQLHEKMLQEIAVGGSDYCPF